MPHIKPQKNKDDETASALLAMQGVKQTLGEMGRMGDFFTRENLQSSAYDIRSAKAAISYSICGSSKNTAVRRTALHSLNRYASFKSAPAALLKLCSVAARQSI